MNDNVEIDTAFMNLFWYLMHSNINVLNSFIYSFIHSINYAGFFLTLIDVFIDLFSDKSFLILHAGDANNFDELTWTVTF